jgi:hypothetical protein
MATLLYSIDDNGTLESKDGVHKVSLSEGAAWWYSVNNIYVGCSFCIDDLLKRYNLELG